MGTETPGQPPFPPGQPLGPRPIPEQRPAAVPPPAQQAPPQPQIARPILPQPQVPPQIARPVVSQPQVQQQPAANLAAELEDIPGGEPPSFQDLLENTLKAPFVPGQVFGRLSKLPAPSVGVALGNVLLWSFAGGALRLLTLDQTGGLFSGPIGIGLYVALLLSGSLLFAVVGAGILHALSILSGGKGDFARSFEALSLLSAILPITAMAAQAPMGVWAALAYGAYLSIFGVSRMHVTPALQAGVVIVTFLALCAGGTVFAQQQFSDAFNRLRLDGLILGAQAAGHGGFLTPAQQAAAPAGSGLDLMRAPGTGNGTVPDNGVVDLQQVQKVMQMAQAMSNSGNGKPASSLDMINSLPAGMAPGQGLIQGIQQMQQGGQPPSGAQLQQMQQQAFAMMQKIQQVASDPNVFNTLTPAQQAQVRQVMQLNASLSSMYQARSQGGTVAAGMSDAQAQQIGRQIQGIVGGIQPSQPAQAPQAAQPPAPASSDGLINATPPQP